MFGVIIGSCPPYLKINVENSSCDDFKSLIQFIGKFSNRYLGDNFTKDNFENGLRVIREVSHKNFQKNIKINCIKNIIGKKESGALAKKNHYALPRKKNYQKVFSDVSVVFKSILLVIAEVEKIEQLPFVINRNNCCDILNPSIGRTLTHIQADLNVRKKRRRLAQKIKNELLEI